MMSTPSSNQRVCIVGAGNSGCDIACDAAVAASKAWISLRRGYHFVPKHLFGWPADVVAAAGPSMPMWLAQPFFSVLLRLLNGDLTRHGLPAPDHKIFESHPIVNSQLLHYLSHGDIAVKPNIERFDHNSVVFADGSRESIDLVIFATGYDTCVPYVPDEYFRWKGGRPDLYLNLFSREHPNLFALGFLETNGGAYKLFDNMADLIARAIIESWKGGERANRLRTMIETDRPDLSGGVRYIHSDRHATYANIDAYKKQMKRLRKTMGWPEIGPGHYRSILRQV